MPSHPELYGSPIVRRWLETYWAYGFPLTFITELKKNCFCRLSAQSRLSSQDRTKQCEYNPFMHNKFTEAAVIQASFQSPDHRFGMASLTVWGRGASQLSTGPGGITQMVRLTKSVMSESMFLQVSVRPMLQSGVAQQNRQDIYCTHGMRVWKSICYRIGPEMQGLVRQREMKSLALYMSYEP